MKIKIKNLGPLRQAEFETGDMTIICGGNNTGKTYATYCLFGFLSYWEDVWVLNVQNDVIEDLFETGVATVDLKQYIESADKIVKQACLEYQKSIHKVFASDDSFFSETDFSIIVSKDDIIIQDEFDRTLRSSKKDIFAISKKNGQLFVHITLLQGSVPSKISADVLKRLIGEALRDIVFGKTFPHPFIASVERTGAAIFRNELDFAKNRMLEHLGTTKGEMDPFELISSVYDFDYPLPVRSNVDFVRKLSSISNDKSFIIDKHPEILHDFHDIIGGEYSVLKGELFFVPESKKKIRLPMKQSSSAVRSMLDLGFYLRHLVQPGDLFMIDEPELNLHPENQRRIARLFACLINIGVKIFITTHSDYLIKELNTLIMLNNDQPHIDQIKDKKGYKTQEMISAGQLKVYVARDATVLVDGNKRKTKVPTLVAADIDDELGIEVDSFDSAINDMNNIQKAVLFGREM